MIGVHTPEFSFEHDAENIRTALRQMTVTWPIAIDKDYGVWQAFANHYCRALLHRCRGADPAPPVR